MCAVNYYNNNDDKIKIVTEIRLHITIIGKIIKYRWLGNQMANNFVIFESTIRMK